jgi:hypothetical protein
MIVHHQKFIIHVESYDLDVAGHIRMLISENGKNSKEYQEYKYATIVESAIGEGGIQMDVNALMKDPVFMKELESALENSCE